MALITALACAAAPVATPVKTSTDEVVTTIRANGGTVDAAYDTAEGRGFAERENRDDARRRTLEWFERCLRDPTM